MAALGVFIPRRFPLKDFHPYRAPRKQESRLTPLPFFADLPDWASSLPKATEEGEALARAIESTKHEEKIGQTASAAVLRDSHAACWPSIFAFERSFFQRIPDFSKAKPLVVLHVHRCEFSHALCGHGERCAGIVEASKGEIHSTSFLP
jgi:hypothetical protein